MEKRVEISRSFDAPVEQLFNMWTRPELLMLWHRPDRDAFTTPRAEVDLREGGEFLIVMSGPDGDHLVRGRYSEVDPPNVLAFTWQWENSESVTSVRVSFTALEHGSRLDLVHTAFADEDSAERHDQGWSGCLDSLALELQENTNVVA